MCTGEEGRMIGKIKLKLMTVSLSLNIITGNTVWVIRNGAKLAPNRKTLSPRGLMGNTSAV